MKLSTLTLLLAGMVAPYHVLASNSLPLSAQQIQTLKALYPISDDELVPLVYQGDPLKIALPVGKEKRLVFAEPIQVDVNGKLTTEQLRVLNNDQSLYLTAQKSFDATRIYVTLKNSQQIILLDLATSEQASIATRTITLAPKKSPQSSSVVEAQQQSSTVSIGADNVLSADSYVNAIRFAWQQLYAPERLLNNLPTFTRSPMHTENFVSTLVYGDKVIAHPAAAWLADGLYVTVVELRNKYPHSTRIDLAHDLCGNWQAAALYPRSALKPMGERTGDSTTLFLISNKPFGEVMEVCNASA